MLLKHLYISRPRCVRCAYCCVCCGFVSLLFLPLSSIPLGLACQTPIIVTALMSLSNQMFVRLPYGLACLPFVNWLVTNPYPVCSVLPLAVLRERKLSFLFSCFPSTFVLTCIAYFVAVLLAFTRYSDFVSFGSLPSDEVGKLPMVQCHNVLTYLCYTSC